MSSTKFYVEGPSDRKFLQDILKHWYEISLPNEFINVLDGKDNLKSRFEEELIRNRPNFITDQIQDIRSVVILDADDNPIHRRQVVSQLAANYQFDFFLWPNNELSGDLESILERIYHPVHQAFFDCWQTYENCLQASGNYYLPNRKGKIFAYLESMLGHTSSQRDLISKPDKRDFLNPNHWTLDPTHPSLKPLKEFLDPFFSIQ